MPTRSTYAVLIALVGVGLLFGGLNTAYQASGSQHTVENASATVDYDAPTQLDAPDRAFNYSQGITVTVDGTQLAEGSDYAYNATGGEVSWLNSTATSDGDSALVDYAYTAPDEGTHERRGILASIVGVIPWAVLGVGVYATIELMDGGW